MLVEIKNNSYILEKDRDVNILITDIKSDWTRDSIGFKEGMEKVKEHFNLYSIGYGIQTHSDIVNIWNGDVVEGDALISEGLNRGIGVFTADCVPVILYDKDKDVFAAVHSGWKGTYNNILGKTIKKLKDEFNCNNIKAVIGPHIRECCYEVSNDLILKFKELDYLNEVQINKSRNLDLNAVIKKQLSMGDIIDINFLNKCTCCDNTTGFHSFRRDGQDSGRIFTMIFIK